MLIWGSEGNGKENSQGQFFCPKCNLLRPYKHKQISKLSTLYFIPLFETKDLGEAVECQVCQNGFDPRALESTYQGLFKLASATRYELLHGASPDEARWRLEAVGLQEEIVDGILRMAQN